MISVKGAANPVSMGIIQMQGLELPDSLFDWVPISKMFVAGYGRPFSPSRVKSLRRDWDPAAIGTVLLSYRSDIERYAILDGHHRMQAAAAEGMTELPARIYLDLTYQDEAKLYIHFAAVKQQTASDKFRARLESREPIALAIQKAVLGQGLLLNLTSNGGGRNVRAIGAIGALDSVTVQYGLESLRETLRILDVGLGGHSLTYSTYFLRGMSAFLHHYPSPPMEERRLILALQRTGVDEIAQRARMLQKTGLAGFRSGTPIGMAILSAYNKGLRATSQLPEWGVR